MRGSTFILAAAVTAILGGCSRPAPVDVPPLDAAAHAFQWSAWGGDAGGSRFAPLKQITPANVAGLQPAWTFHTGALGKGWESGEKLTFEATPLFVDGTLYFSTATGQVFALDAARGKERWRHDAQLDATESYSELASRGVSYWRDPQAAAGSPCAARIFTGTADARLIALDAATGKPCEGFGEHGELHLSAHLLRDSYKGDYEFTSPPVIDGDTLILGSSIGDNYSAANALGVVRAFDARSGAARWHWNPMQGTPDAGDGDATPYPTSNGAANAWGVLSVDATRHLVFIPTGSASPDPYGGERAGDNHWANSLVALDTATGKIVWARQLVHHDVWDYDLAAQPMLIDLKRDGQSIPAVVQLTKTGQVFVFRRDDGTPLFDITEKPVPQDGAPGEKLSPTQPFSALPSLVRSGKVTPDDAHGLTFWDRNRCRALIGSLKSEGIFTPPSLQGTIEMPSYAGGVNWGSGAWDPATQTMVTNVNDLPMQVQLLPREEWERQVKAGGEKHWEYAAMKHTPYGMRRRVLRSPLGAPCIATPWGKVVALNLSTGRVDWSIPLGTGKHKAPWPISIKGMPGMGGPLMTASGLVFIGAASDGYFRALDRATGKELWRAELPAPGMATPMTYAVGSRQYVVIAAGGHGKLDTQIGDALVAFKLPE
ncbi:pyrroloquinoline quinone-dependent dehydrogenase [Dyella sp.]|jgi:quinoprotein glucose dehydrogenase|uniref:pyrroloquinoline quinone-dependent dehydrogenase n=1 Tax=Dyella sp. TaxID=1869338 RepID=UPI002D782C17|nr:pyrroloquinoline quinone-dependent dehydrogenase [Dyella sp.]HET6432833.1 pyrroloquinoline quinone-dependent dehydrogenase [Dyella sp.]